MAGIRDTEVLASRVSHTVVESLRAEAHQKRVILNTLVNQVFQNHVNHYSPMLDKDFIPLPAIAVQKMMDQISKQDLTRIAHEAAESIVADRILIMRENHKQESFNNLLKTWCTVAGLAYLEKEERGKSVCIVQHNMGDKFSLFLEQIFYIILSRSVQNKFTIERPNDSVIIVTYDTHL